MQWFGLERSRKKDIAHGKKSLQIGKYDFWLAKLILDTLWGDDSFFNSRKPEVYITRLRQYLKQDGIVQILTLKAVGYRLVDR